MVIASVGHRTAHNPHRIQRSSSLIMAESGNPCAAARSVKVARTSASRHDCQAALGTDVDAAVAQHARLGVVNRLDVAHEAAGRLFDRVGTRVARLDFRNARAPPYVERRRRHAIELLEARNHPVSRGGQFFDVQVKA